MMIIAVDFDGTIAEHHYPSIGPPVPGAIDWLKRWIEAGAAIILWTMRSDSPQSGPKLTEAVEWLRAFGIRLAGVNHNPDQASWTMSPKAYAHIYVDDAAAGCPVIDSPNAPGRVMVDWSVVGPLVLKRIEDERRLMGKAYALAGGGASRRQLVAEANAVEDAIERGDSSPLPADL